MGTVRVAKPVGTHTGHAGTVSDTLHEVVGIKPRQRPAPLVQQHRLIRGPGTSEVGHRLGRELHRAGFPTLSVQAHHSGPVHVEADVSPVQPVPLSLPLPRPRRGHAELGHPCTSCVEEPDQAALETGRRRGEETV